MSCDTKCPCGGWSGDRLKRSECPHEWVVFAVEVYKGKLTHHDGNCHRCGATVKHTSETKASMKLHVEMVKCRAALLGRPLA